MRLSLSWYVITGSALLIALVSFRWLFVPITLVMDHMAHYIPTLPTPLYLHLFFAPLALLLMPFQFWGKLRAKRPTVHRQLGYIYAASIILAGGASLWLLPEFKGTWFAALGFGLLGMAWIGSTVTAIQHARKRDYAAHRRWMLRSATLTFAAVTLRVIMAPLIASGWDVVETYNVTAFGSWVPSLLFMEWWMRRQGQ